MSVIITKCNVLPSVTGLLDCAEDDYYDPQMFMDGAFQVIKWQAFQQNKWAVLLDEHGKEL